MLLRTCAVAALAIAALAATPAAAQSVAGGHATGVDSLAVGTGATASSDDSTATGQDSTASGYESTHRSEQLRLGRQQHSNRSGQRRSEEHTSELQLLMRL